MKKGLLLFFIGMSGCTPPGIPLDEQIEAVKKCREAGGVVSESRYTGTGEVAYVNCYFDGRSDWGGACKKKGGVPIFSSWDGSLKDCKFEGAK